MKQNDNRIFRKEDLDWKTLETIGIHKEEPVSYTHLTLPTT